MHEHWTYAPVLSFSLEGQQPMYFQDLLIKIIWHMNHPTAFTHMTSSEEQCCTNKSMQSSGFKDKGSSFCCPSANNTSLCPPLINSGSETQSISSTDRKPKGSTSLQIGLSGFLWGLASWLAPVNTRIADPQCLQTAVFDSSPIPEPAASQEPHYSSINNQPQFKTLFRPTYCFFPPF